MTEEYPAGLDFVTTEAELFVSWEDGEEGKEGEWIVKIAQSIEEIGVSLAD